MINLVEKLKNAPKGTKLYSTIFGEVKFQRITDDEYPIEVKCGDGVGYPYKFASDGRYYSNYKGECVLFPSKENRDWNTFNTPKFNISELKPFDKVLVRDINTNKWTCSFYSYYECDSNYPYVTSKCIYKQCIPYNDETAHLLGTTDDCPDYYKTW